jgi:hypothetical protein
MAKHPLFGLAKRWLEEQVATDHRADERIAQIEWQASRAAQEQLGQALLPGLHRRNEEAAARRQDARDAAQADRRAGMATAGGGLHISGSLTGALPAPLPVQVEVEDDVLLLAVEPADAARPAVAGSVAFRRLDLAIPGYAGPGTYDLRAAHTDDWDPLWFALVLDVEDEPFWWVPDTGACTVACDPDGLGLEIAFADAAGRSVVLSGRLEVALPQ